MPVLLNLKWHRPARRGICFVFGQTRHVQIPRGVYPEQQIPLPRLRDRNDKVRGSGLRPPKGLSSPEGSR